MARSVRHGRNSRAGYGLLVLGALACLGAPTAQAQYQVQIGPKVLYPTANNFTNHVNLPLVMRDAIQNIAIGTRLLAIKPRIMGGDPAPFGIYPWAASIGLKGAAPRDGHFCGGSFIAPDWVLTAAHCLKADSAPTIQVYGGSNELERNGTVFPVDRVVVHERYDDGTQENDVALVHVTRRYTGEMVRLLEPADTERFASDGTLAVVVGWGLTAEGGAVQNALRRVTVQILSNKTCNGLAAYAGAVSDGMLCAGFPEGGKDSCQGDSGGPMVVGDGKGNRLQVGIVSWGEGCGRPNKFGVYTRVSSVHQWIADRLAGRAVSRAPRAPEAARAPTVSPSVPQATRSAAPTPAPETSAPAPRSKNGVASNSRAQADKPAVRPKAKHSGKKAAGKPRKTSEIVAPVDAYAFATPEVLH
jgi:secreted trypsin-like serine protease